MRVHPEDHAPRFSAVTSGQPETPSKAVFRVQDWVGRGPYRPGFSHRWTDFDHNDRNPPIFEDFPDYDRLMRRRAYYGCAFRSLDLARAWFSPREIGALQALGYYFVSLVPDRIIAESATQMIIACDKPLSRRAVLVPWSLLTEAA